MSFHLRTFGMSGLHGWPWLAAGGCLANPQTCTQSQHSKQTCSRLQKCEQRAAPGAATFSQVLTTHTYRRRSSRLLVKARWRPGGWARPCDQVAHLSICACATTHSSSAVATASGPTRSIALLLVGLDHREEGAGGRGGA